MIRPMLPADRRFVLSGWSASWRTSRDISFVPMSMWSTFSHPVIEHALDRVSVLVDESEVLRGFIAYEPGYVWYCYVPQPFRYNGIARSLFAAAGIDPSSRFAYACRTLGSWQCRAKIPSAVYDPFKARFPKEQDEQREPEVTYRRQAR